MHFVSGLNLFPVYLHKIVHLHAGLYRTAVHSVQVDILKELSVQTDYWKINLPQAGGRGYFGLLQCDNKSNASVVE